MTSEKNIKDLRQLRKQVSAMQKANETVLQTIDDMLGASHKPALASSIKKKVLTHQERVNKYL
jgi:hypothetical protein